jgi:hypothetical protein
VRIIVVKISPEIFLYQSGLKAHEVRGGERLEDDGKSVAAILVENNICFLSVVVTSIGCATIDPSALRMLYVAIMDLMIAGTAPSFLTGNMKWRFWHPGSPRRV